MSEIYHPTDATFDEDVLSSPLPVLVEFWATWCGPCRAVAPVLDRLAAKYDGRLLIAKVDVDRASGIASRYRVRNVPRFVLFKDGQEVAALLGAHPQQRIEQMIDGHVAAAPVAPAPTIQSMPSASILPAQGFDANQNQNPLDDFIQPAGRRR